MTTEPFTSGLTGRMVASSLRKSPVRPATSFSFRIIWSSNPHNRTGTRIQTLSCLEQRGGLGNGIA